MHLIRPQHAKRASFSLIELMVTVGVLAFGIVFLYQGFFTSLSAFSYSQNGYDVGLWMDEYLWNLQDQLTRYKSFFAQERQGEVVLGGKKYTWTLFDTLIQATEDFNLYEVTVIVNWREGIRSIRMGRGTYMSYEKE